MKLAGAVCIVTGSATGIGAATAIALAAKGARVVVNYSRSEAAARATRDACVAAGGEAILVQADVAEDADCRRLAQAALDQWGRIDALVNNAGTTKFAGTPGEVADVIAWLIEGAALVTGEVFMVDSGMHMGPVPRR